MNVSAASVSRTKRRTPGVSQPKRPHVEFLQHFHPDARAQRLLWYHRIMGNLTRALKRASWLSITTAILGAMVTVLLCHALVRSLSVGFVPRGAEIATLGTLGFGMMLSVLLASIVSFHQTTARSR